MEVTLIDSPVANVANIARALRAAGGELRVTDDADAIAGAAKIVLPGVGSFAAARSWLVETRIDDALQTAVSRGATLLGICAGHQLLFEASHEMGTTPGLGFFRGDVRRLETTLPVPQIGWNRVSFGAADPLFSGIAQDTAFYFVNSYAAVDLADSAATAMYGIPFIAAARRGRVAGVQFHPEKSSAAGLQLLRNFLSWT